MKKLLFQLDTDEIPSIFDTVVGYDGGADHITCISGVTSENIAKIVQGAIYTRPPKHKKNTALFVTGSNMEKGIAVFYAIFKHFIDDFRVSVMLDSNGSNTTAATAVAHIRKYSPIAGKKAVILAGTGPVGQRAGVMLAKEGAQVVLTSRSHEKGEAVCRAISRSFDLELQAAVVTDAVSTDAVIDGAHFVLATGAAGYRLLGEEVWRNHPSIEILADVNVTPPLGIQGIDVMDKATERHGRLCFGGIGLGSFKLQLQRACIAGLFERNDRIFDALEISALAKQLL